MTLVDSYRRRGKKPKPFPVTSPREVEIGDGTVTTYTFGQDLYDAMLAAIRGARRQILLETYIWKGDELGELFKQALVEAARRGVDVYVIFDSFANLVVSPAFKRFPAEVKVLRYPVYSRRAALLGPAALRPRPPQDPGGRRGGRLRRRLQPRVGRTPRSGATPTCASPDPACGTCSARSPTSGTSTAASGIGPQRAAPAAGDGVAVGAADPVPPQHPAAVDVPDPVDVPRGDRPRHRQHLDDARLLHPRPGLRRRAEGRRPARASTSGC